MLAWDRTIVRSGEVKGHLHRTYGRDKMHKHGFLFEPQNHDVDQDDGVDQVKGHRDK